MVSQYKLTSILFICSSIIFACVAQDSTTSSMLDKKVRSFLKANKKSWHDMNVPESDGETLYNLIIKNSYKNALEIGTSTGHSGIWMAWALSKTGGKLTTIEINKNRYEKALSNFREAGLAEYIDARLGDAHQLVKELEDSFDFIFVDADKNWYRRYLELLYPKLEVGGCFTAHNVLNTYMAGIQEFLDYLVNLSYFKTSITKSSSSGISVSYKIADKPEK